MSRINIGFGVEKMNVRILALTDTDVTYEVTGVPIAEYDQHARARVGVSFFDYKISERPNYIFYTYFKDNLPDTTDALLEDVENHRDNALYANQGSEVEWNLMSRECSYKVKQTFQSLKGQMQRRLKFCEEEFIVGVHWKLRAELDAAGVDVSEYVPGCDLIKKCDYAQADYLSNAFGCLFAGCGRWPDEASFASFNFSCTTPEQLSAQLGIAQKYFEL